MGDNSKIEWTDASWNVITGCTKVSPGCDHCYAERITNRFGGPGAFDMIAVHLDRLGLPLRWRRPRKVFVNSMSDLFHDDVPDELIARMVAVMALAPQHTFQVLTKRHARMRSLLSVTPTERSVTFHREVELAAADLVQSGVRSVPTSWPLPNLWLGVSVETQQWADIRIPALVDTLAAVRFLSCEPLLGGVTLRRQIAGYLEGWRINNQAQRETCAAVDWVIIGGESGPGARPMHPDWVRTLRDECVAAGVPLHFKQFGEWVPEERSRATHLLNANGSLITVAQGTSEQTYGSGSPVKSDLIDRGHPGWVRVRKVGKKLAGRTLDGREWDEYPHD